MPTDLLLIHPGNPQRTYQGLADTLAAIDVPLWSLLVAGYLRPRGWDVRIHDSAVQGWSADGVPALIARHQPRLIALLVYGHQPSASTQTMPAAIQVIRDLKACGVSIPIAVGGTHASALPEETLAETGADFVIQGEGFRTVDGLLEHLARGTPLAEVPGLWYRAGGRAASTRPAELIADLDAAIPRLPWSLLEPLQRYRAHNWHCFQDFEKSRRENGADVRSPYVSLYSSLGCPFHCDFCCIHAVFGRPSLRTWSVETVVGWIDELVKDHGVRNIRFADELFVLKRDRMNRFCDALIERGYDLNLWVYARVDTLEGALLAKMRRAGIRWVCLGIESASETVRAGVHKGYGADVREAIASLKRAGLYIMGNYIFGLPDDTRESMEATLALAEELNCEFANFYCAMAYPGSPLYRTARELGWPVPTDWSAYSQHSYETCPLPTRHLGAAEVLRFRDEAFLRYFTSPRYLDMVERTFGAKVRTHVLEMSRHRLKRRLLEAAR